MIYFDTTDYSRKVRIKSEIIDILKNYSNTPIILLGYLSFIGIQNLDRTGNMILDIAEKQNMLILNGGPLAYMRDELTWSRDKQNSAIDIK